MIINCEVKGAVEPKRFQVALRAWKLNEKHRVGILLVVAFLPAGTAQRR